MKIFEGMHKYAWLEFGIWIVILCLCVGTIRFHHYKKQKHMVTYQIFMPDVDGMIVGSPVKFMGVQVGYIDKIKIVGNDVYLKIVINKSGVNLPKGAIATVEFNGMGGSKSLEVYPPTKESLASNKLILVQEPIRLNDAIVLFNDMFDKIGAITTKVSSFVKETGIVDMPQGINTSTIKDNEILLDNFIKKVGEIKKEGVKNEQGKSKSN